MKIAIEFNTLNADFEDNRIDAIIHIMEQAKEKVIDSLLTNNIAITRVPIMDINGNRIGVLEVNI